MGHFLVRTNSRASGGGAADARGCGCRGCDVIAHGNSSGAAIIFDFGSFDSNLTLTAATYSIDLNLNNLTTSN